jgi:arsenite oxidase small subunit
MGSPARRRIGFARNPSSHPMPIDKDTPAPACALTRREFVKLGGAAVSGTVASGLLPAFAADPVKSTAYPVADLGPVSALKVDSPVPFTYPDESSPAILLRLRESAKGGIGPGNSIVAYSILCTHKGCPVSYRAERKLLICPCHWSSFDPTKGGQMVIGQGSQALPQVTLRLQGDTIQAVGLEGLIYGRYTNVL